MADWTWKGNQAKQDMESLIARELTIIAGNLKPIIEAHTPVQSGKMKASWDLEVQRATRQIIITNRMPYWIFVELGTSRMAARAPLRKALAAFNKSGVSGKLFGSFSVKAAGKPKAFKTYFKNVGGQMVKHRARGI